MTIWHAVNGRDHLSKIAINAYRVVEDQSKSTTRKFVDTAQEHELLEQLIEESKPAIKYYGDETHFKKIHYLLTTPFRYPPLKWGARFCTRSERALLYASNDLETALSEKAFYLMTFLQASEGKVGGKTQSYTTFKVAITSDRFIDLCSLPFKDYTEQISNKESYTFAQALGAQMRNDDIECFQYQSARSHRSEKNFGVFTPKALSNNRNLEKTFQHINCFSSKKVIEFSNRLNPNTPTYIFKEEQYLVNGRLPLPPT